MLQSRDQGPTPEQSLSFRGLKSSKILSPRPAARRIIIEEDPADKTSHGAAFVASPSARTALRPRDQRNYAAWVPSTSAHKEVARELGLRDSITEDDFFRSYNTPHIQGIARDWQASFAKAYAMEQEVARGKPSPLLQNDLIGNDESLYEQNYLDGHCLAHGPWNPGVTKLSSTGVHDSRLLHAKAPAMVDFIIGIMDCVQGLQTNFVEIINVFDCQTFPVTQQLELCGSLRRLHLFNIDQTDPNSSAITCQNHKRLIDGRIIFRDVLDQAQRDPASAREDPLRHTTQNPTTLRISSGSKKPNGTRMESAEIIENGVNIFQAFVTSVDGAIDCVATFLTFLELRGNAKSTSHNQRIPALDLDSVVLQSPRREPHGLLDPDQGSPIVRTVGSHDDMRRLGGKASGGLKLAFGGHQRSGNQESAKTTSQDSNLSSQTLVGSDDTSDDSTSHQKVYSFRHLVDQLIGKPEPKSRTDFLEFFLTLYRLFAAPIEVLGSLIDRFTTPHCEQDGLGIRDYQERVLGIMYYWIHTHPGDFGHDSSRARMYAFLSTIDPTSSLSTVARQIRATLDLAVFDDDTGWACSDSSRAPTDTARTSCTSPTLSTRASASFGSRSSSRAMSTHKDDVDCQIIFRRKSTMTLTAMGPSRSRSESNHSSLTIINAFESAQRQAALLTPHPCEFLTKAIWHRFIALPDSDIASELTRIDWIMFSAVRPRDLLRHATISAENRGRFPGLANVTRMVDHFNHIACWVVNMVLLREKPKDRALMLEKFMRLARKLRDMNNYNSMGAVVAGLLSTSVIRLTASKELVSPEVLKDFMKLEILMSTHKGHFAYRLAWENTQSERVPFFALHRRDLVLASEGNKPVAEKGTENDPETRMINLKSVEIIGEILCGIHKAQTTPYNEFKANEEVESLILDISLIKDEDELFARSKKLEPNPPPVNDLLASVAPKASLYGSNAGMTEVSSRSVRKKLSWFAKYGI